MTESKLGVITGAYIVVPVYFEYVRAMLITPTEIIEARKLHTK